MITLLIDMALSPFDDGHRLEVLFFPRGIAQAGITAGDIQVGVPEQFADTLQWRTGIDQIRCIGVP